ncbi:ammonia channel precursor [Desulfosporosinus acididurans]|uniref:Ammonium transporter n=1 Tax=Desulfosporosinus acididurans TaxID=476652 RepID=A0A0J1ILK5_9FIRM|nr:ammonium transporter [Desulfosporosinus acididurans]KLU65591.1 ammonia channel precursor [Desulfosporosinus acididurans]
MKRSKLIKITLLTVFLILMIATVALAAGGDPSGANTGGIADIAAAKAGDPTLSEVAAQVGKNKIGINFVWTLLTGFMVFFMQAGFALVEAGFTRAKNAAHTMAMNLMVFLVGAIGYYLVGFGLMFGGVGAVGALGGTPPLTGEFAVNGWGLFGHTGFFLTSGGTYDVGVFILFLFQMVFMDTAVTIPTGAQAERIKFSAVVIGSFFISMILYPIYGNWVWGGGWLSQIGSKWGLGHGVVDFAGSGVVHSIGGGCALAAALVLGPRIGKYVNGKVNVIPGHDIPMAILGTIILFFGWFGFNPGSTLAGTDLRISVVAVNTMLAGAVGGFVAMMIMWIKYKKPDPSMMCNGTLAGLVAITAPSGFVSVNSAVIIGAIAGALVVASVLFIDRKLKIDDPVGAISVHMVNGIWGVISVGIFADGTYGDGLNGVAGGVTGLLYGNVGQFGAQLIDAAVVLVWSIGLSYIFFKILNATLGMRVKPEDELAGLDIPEMGMLAYPEFVMQSSTGE